MTARRKRKRAPPTSLNAVKAERELDANTRAPRVILLQLMDSARDFIRGCPMPLREEAQARMDRAVLGIESGDDLGRKRRLAELRQRPSDDVAAEALVALSNALLHVAIQLYVDAIVVGDDKGNALRYDLLMPFINLAHALHMGGTALAAGALDNPRSRRRRQLEAFAVTFFAYRRDVFAILAARDASKGTSRENQDQEET